MLAARDRLRSGASCWPADVAILAHLLAALGALCRLARFGHLCRLGAFVTFSVHRHDGKADDSHTLAIAPSAHPHSRQILPVYPEQLQLTWRIIFAKKHCGKI